MYSPPHSPFFLITSLLLADQAVDGGAKGVTGLFFSPPLSFLPILPSVHSQMKEVRERWNERGLCSLPYSPLFLSLGWREGFKGQDVVRFPLSLPFLSSRTFLIDGRVTRGLKGRDDSPTSPSSSPPLVKRIPFLFPAFFFRWTSRRDGANPEESRPGCSSSFLFFLAFSRRKRRKITRFRRWSCSLPPPSPFFRTSLSFPFSLPPRGRPTSNVEDMDKKDRASSLFFPAECSFFLAARCP